MAEEGFLRRWSRRKSQSLRGDEPAPEPGPVAPFDAGPAVHPAVHADAGAAVAPPAQGAPAGRPPPTLDDVARLTPDADFSSFVARGVDPLVRRSALKKLFTDPHFHAMDGLDVYIDDYTKPSPVPEAMLASLGHARRVLRRLAGDEPGAETKPAQDTTIKPEDETP
jgi:hypothetical protein